MTDRKPGTLQDLWARDLQEGVKETFDTFREGLKKNGTVEIPAKKDNQDKGD